MVVHWLIVLAVIAFCRPNLVQRHLIPLVVTAKPVSVVSNHRAVSWPGEWWRRVVQRSHTPQVSVATPVGFAFEHWNKRDARVVVIFPDFLLGDRLCVIHFPTCDLKRDIGSYSDRLLFLVRLTGWGAVTATASRFCRKFIFNFGNKFFNCEATF